MEGQVFASVLAGFALGWFAGAAWQKYRDRKRAGTGAVGPDKRGPDAKH